MPHDLFHLFFSLSLLYYVSFLALIYLAIFFFFKQKTAYYMRISDWSSDVCSSDLPEEGKVTAFVFKIQANMDPKHRDRIAFVRLSSGHFRRGMKLKHVRSGKVMTMHNPVLFLARDRETAEEAWPADIIGLPNHGNLRIGDTLTEGEDLHVPGIPDRKSTRLNSSH